MSEKQIKADLDAYQMTVTRIVVEASMIGALDDFDVKARLIDMLEDELADLKAKWQEDTDADG
ncbi:hypothetical protein KKE60_07975 [Patescibacteria group bacterium]|nr:hypothetical protein [Patescibacteria group bacterium]